MSHQKVDLAQIPDPDSDAFFDLPPEEQFLIEDAIFYTEEATAIPAGKKVISRLNCQQETEYDICLGDVELTRYNVPTEIRWRCKECNAKGTITNFLDTPWDLTKVPEKEAREWLDQKYAEPFLTEPLGDAEIINEFMNWVEGLSEEDYRELQASADEMDADINFFEAGLSPQHLEELIISDWTKPGSPVYLKEDLTLAEIGHNFFLHNARVFLQQLQDSGAFELTKNEYLKRKYVEGFIDQFMWPKGFIERRKKYNKVFNEIDVWLLHGLRVLLDIAGLIRKEKGKFYPVKKRIHLLKEENAGQLYQHLFSAFFKEMNICYFTNSEPVPLFQESVPFMLWRMQFMNEEWHPIGEVMDDCLLEVARTDLYSLIRFEFQQLDEKFYRVFLRPLELFGLVETRQDSPVEFLPEPDHVRKTPLFDKFLSFKADDL